MKTKCTALVLCLCMLAAACLSLAACTSESNGTETDTSTGGTASETTAPTTEAPTDASTESSAGAPVESDREGDTTMETEAPPVLNQAEVDRMNAMLSESFAGRELPIGGWSTPASALRDHNTGVEGSYDKAYQLLADAGLNYMITLEEWSSGSWPLESLSSAKKAGMKLWYNCVGMSADYSMEKINALLSSPDADALAAIYTKDEPTFDAIGETADTMDAIRKALGEDHALPLLANLLPTYASPDWITNDYRNYVRTYLETAKPDRLMFDYYPFGPSKDSDSITAMMVNIAIAKEEADRAGVELYTFLQSSGQPTMREPNVEELRFNAHLNLAMGVKGFAYFLVCEHYEGWEYSNMVTAKGETTELYEKVKTVNAELAAMKGVFLDYHYRGILPVSYAAVDRLMERKGVTDTVLDSFGAIREIQTLRNSKAVIGCFESPDGQNEAYYVVNAEYDHKSTVTLTFDKAQSFVIWSKDGARQVENTSELKLELTSGEGVFVVKFDVNP